MTLLYRNVEVTYEKKHYYAKFTAHKDCDSIFGEKLDQFFLKELKIELDDNGAPYYHTTPNFHFDSLDMILQGYLSGTNFNPNNPIKYFIKEYVKWGLPTTRKEVYWDARSKIVTFCWHVLDTPEGRHPTQLSVARELKEEILRVKDTLPEITQELIDEGISLFESGNIEGYFLSEYADYVNSPHHKFIRENLGIKFW